MKHVLQALALASLLALGQQVSATEPPGGGTPDVATKKPLPVPGAVVKPQTGTTTQATAVIGKAAAPYLTDAQRRALQDYYAGSDKRAKKCPPGLAKKNNGCMPPGQAKKWASGQTLPADVTSQPVPEDVLRRIGISQKGVELVRVLGDIVVLQKGTRLVMDSVELPAGR